MSVDIFGMKAVSSGSSTNSVEPWSSVITLAESGKGCDGLFELYRSLGNQTIVGTHRIPSFNDGPEKVVCYDDLTIGDGTTLTDFTTTTRCKGLTVIVKGNFRVKNNASLNMYAKSPYIVSNDIPFFPFVDFKIPFKVSLASSIMNTSSALELICNGGHAPWDKGFWDVFGSMIGLQCSVVEDGSVTLIPATSLAAATISGGNNLQQWWTGYPGAGKSNGSSGGGGSGAWYGHGNYNIYGARGGGSTPYGGGAGGSGNHCLANAENYAVGGHGIYSMPSFGSAYSPTTSHAGGGKLTVICKGNVTIDSGGKVESGGYGSGGNAWGAAGGGSVFIIYGGTLTNNGTIQSPGGVGAATGGISGAAGGQGGVGSVVTKTFAQMGW